ncbi:hypothetical protein WICMUC_002576 [Wickerhamomyces mucosus]|uniref:Uncharacterized protein n=1 Tax=Wickerhamomyces mucosus TaxID=1378264 RepID=A0A9P8PQU6_9ASCO|nr:hypothetical protein WICMUC_002576 [Wickerhamomyces mucosus]
MGKYTRLARFTAILAFVIFISVHFLTSKNRFQETISLKDQITREKYDINPELTPARVTNIKTEYSDLMAYEERANAAFMTLARNEDLDKLAQSIRSVEDRFNHRFHYDWVFLNNEEFTIEFQKQIRNLCSGNVTFYKIPEEFWSYPELIDMRKVFNNRISSRVEMPYGSSENYRFMCRFFSGFFYRLPVIKDYDYVWRVEPDIKLHCDINYDVFKFMIDNDKHYGFTISIREFPKTIPSLWHHVQEFLKTFPRFLNEFHFLDFISDDEGKSYNLCHFWTNFEIIDLRFLQSEAYESFFQYLDRTNGFFYERWGDAPIHSIAVALFMSKHQIHFFDDIGYFHDPISNCPINNDIWTNNHCFCDQQKDATFKDYSCTRQFYDLLNLNKPKGWEKYTGIK